MLAAFLFLIGGEGLSGVIEIPKEHNLYSRFKVGAQGLTVSHL